MPRKPSAGEGFADGLIIDSKPLMERMEWDMYEKVDQSPLNRQTSLKTALSRNPAVWLDATCALYQIAGTLKQERVDSLVLYLTDPRHLANIVHSLSDLHRDALTTVIEAQGWTRYGKISQLVGDEGPDSYFWEKSPPTSIIGQLRMRGLIFVGHTTVAGRKCKVAVIPKDLRAPLSLVLLSAPEPPDGT